LEEVQLQIKAAPFLGLEKLSPEKRDRATTGNKFLITCIVALRDEILELS
jgi:hypothetical protein